MSNELQIAFNEIAEMRSLPADVVLEALQSALVSAYRRDSGASSAQAIEARIDPQTGRARVFVEKEVVDEIFTDATEVTLEKARFYNPEAQLNDVVMVQVENTTKNFGRIAAQTAKQVILQKIREAERNALYEEFINREGDLITGTVQSVNSRQVTLSLGRAEADLPRSQQIPGERYRPHEKTRVYVMEVKKSNRGPQIIVSRAHRSMLRRLLEYEVPEIYNGQVEIKSIAREAGHRSKVAVAALQDGIDPVGACVGMRGIRIQNIVKELHDEKIDVIEWSTDAEAFISKALSPARVTGVYLDDDPIDGRTAVVVVPDDQLSLAIGREGQNARLAAKLTGWRIDIKSVTETVQGALQNLDIHPLSSLEGKYPDLVEESTRILEKKNNDLTVMPEEYRTLGRFADVVEQLLLEERDAARDLRMQEINAVKSTLPPEMFELPLDVLAVSQDILDILEQYENVGEVMLDCLVNEDGVAKKVSEIDGDPMTEIQGALDIIMMADLEDLLKEAQAVEDLEDEDEATEESTESAITEIEEPVVEEATDEEEIIPSAEIDDDAEDEDVAMLDAFGQPVVHKEEEPEVSEEEPVIEEVIEEIVESAQMIPEFLDDDEEEDSFDRERAPKGKKKRRSERQKRRQLVLDEDSGEVIAKRRRKGSRGSWDDETDYDF
jgi:transcription termination/antitermination protein NusA